MKFQLGKEWFEKRIHPEEDFEVGAGVPPDRRENGHEACDTVPEQPQRPEGTAPTDRGTPVR